MATDIEFVKVKNKFVLVHDMQAYRGRRNTAPVILNLGNGWR
jgi:hypothetical protein